MKFVLPPHKLLVIIFLITLINPLHYALLFFFPPENNIFLGYPDDTLMLTLMKSPAWNFDDPWSFDGGKVWHNPLIGSVYLFISLGAIPFLFKLDLYLSFIFFKFLFSVIYFIVVYNLLSVFIKSGKERNVALLIFMFVAGLGGLIYATSTLAFPQSQYNSVIGYALTNEFNELSATSHSLTHTFRLYYMIPETLGYLSLIFFLSRKRLFSGVLLGLVFLFYPTYGVAFSLVIIIHSLLRLLSKREGFVSVLKAVIPTYIVAALFVIPWLIASFQRSYYYKVNSSVFQDLPTINIIIGSFFSLVFVCYVLRKRSVIKNYTKIILPLFVTILFILKQFFEISLRSSLFESWLVDKKIMGLVEFLGRYSFLIDAFMILIAILAFVRISRNSINFDCKFLISWFVIFAVLSGITPENIMHIAYTERQASLLLFPISILAAFGVIEFSRKFRKNTYLVVAAIILLSIPSLLGYNLWMQKSVRESGISGFFTEDEQKVLQFLKVQEDGNVLSSTRFGSYIPYYADKRTLLFTGRTLNTTDDYLSSVSNDYKRFFSGGDNDRIDVINRYKIKYVIIGRDEKPILSFDPESISYLKRIYNGETKIYKVHL